MAKLTYPLPPGAKIVKMLPEIEGEVGVMVNLTLPLGVADLFASALEYAARVTGSERLGARMAAICMEVLGEWQAQAHADMPPSFLGLPRTGLAFGAMGARDNGPPIKATSVRVVDGDCLPVGDGSGRRICLMPGCGGLFFPLFPWQSHCSNICRRRDWAARAFLRSLFTSRENSNDKQEE